MDLPGFFRADGFLRNFISLKMSKYIELISFKKVLGREDSLTHLRSLSPDGDVTENGNDEKILSHFIYNNGCAITDFGR
jgi:hypothetical protein